METKYILSQVFAAISIMCLASTYFCKNKKLIMFLCVSNSLFYGLQYLFLGAFAGFMVNMVSTVRNVWFYKNAKKGKKNTLLSLLILVCLYILFSIIFYEGPFTLLALSACLMFTYAVWQDNNKVYKFLSLPVSMCYIFYNYHFNSIVGLVSEISLFICEVLSIIYPLLKNKICFISMKKLVNTK